MDKFVGYRCSLCNTEYLQGQVTYNCPKDGGNLDVILDLQAIGKKYQAEDITNRTDDSIWRYLPLLPIADPGGEGTPLRFVGWTPVYRMGNISNELGVMNLWVKDESKNPTASFKDRASAVVVARANVLGGAGGKPPVVVTASTGNAGAALAGMAAALGQKAVIFAPKNAPPAKVVQLLVFGAKVILVDGTYDEAFDLSINASHAFGWYCRNTGYNPFTIEGKKTAAFEIWEWFEEMKESQSTSIENPGLTIFVSVGDGNIISGLHKGFKELKELGWMERVPKIIGVQAEGSAAIANAFNNNTEIIQPVSAHTLADSISVNLPRDGVRAVRAVRETGGFYITVSDEEILRSISKMGKAGVFCEPAGATSLAGLQKAVELNMIQTGEPILIINTGSGLKDVKAAMQAVDHAPIIEPTLEALKRIL